MDPKPTTILYVGDWDPSGLYMSEVDLPENRIAFEKMEQRLRGCSHPLQRWQCELPTLEDEAPLELTPGALLVETFAFHHEIRHKA